MGCGESKEVKVEVPDVKVEVPTLKAGKKRDDVMALFKTFDTAENGMISLASLKGATVKVGPSESSVLQRMQEMDLNGDGFVEQSEWEVYFATVVETLSDDELKFILDELSEAGTQLATIAACVKMAAEEPVEDGTPSAEAATEELKKMELKGKQKELVVALFNEWDTGSVGYIDRSKLSATGVAVGPREEKIFANFDQMDLDQDNKVTLDEMLTYFSVVASMMGEKEFAEAVEEMKMVVNSENAREAMVAMAVEAAEEGAAIVGDDDLIRPDKLADLSPDRAELVQSLFLAFGGADTSQPIELSALSDAKVEVGPMVESPLEKMKLMDANGDGKVEYEEVRQAKPAAAGAAAHDRSTHHSPLSPLTTLTTSPLSDGRLLQVRRQGAGRRVVLSRAQRLEGYGRTRADAQRRDRCRRVMRGS